MLPLQTVTSVPADTTRVAKHALPSEIACVAIRDHMGTLFEDMVVALLFPSRGHCAAAPWRLVLATILRFAERLSDRDAAEIARTRINWKYLLGLELIDPGIDYSILSWF